MSFTSLFRFVSLDHQLQRREEDEKEICEANLYTRPKENPRAALDTPEPLTADESRLRRNEKSSMNRDKRFKGCERKSREPRHPRGRQWFELISTKAPTRTEGHAILDSNLKNRVREEGMGCMRMRVQDDRSSRVVVG